MKKEIFDDFVIEAESSWTQVCEKCSEKYSELVYLEEIPVATICGVKQCNNEAKYYLTIHKEDFSNEK